MLGIGRVVGRGRPVNRRLDAVAVGVWLAAVILMAAGHVFGDSTIGVAAASFFLWLACWAVLRGTSRPSVR